MTIQIHQLATQALSGSYQQAAAAAAQERGARGSDIGAARRMAKLAAAADDTRLLALAWALCPEALGVGAAAFLAGLPPAAARYCIQNCEALRERGLAQALLEVAREEEKSARLATEAKAAQGAGQRGAKSKGSASQAAAKAPSPAPTIVRKKIARSLDIEALRAAAREGRSE